MSMIDTAYAERLAEETKAMELKAFLQKIADDERAMAEKAAQEQRNEEELRELDKRIDMEVAAATSIALAAYAASTATAVTTNNEHGTTQIASLDNVKQEIVNLGELTNGGDRETVAKLAQYLPSEISPMEREEFKDKISTMKEIPVVATAWKKDEFVEPNRDGSVDKPRFTARGKTLEELVPVVEKESKIVDNAYKVIDPVAPQADAFQMKQVLSQNFHQNLGELESEIEMEKLKANPTRTVNLAGSEASILDCSDMTRELTQDRMEEKAFKSVLDNYNLNKDEDVAKFAKYEHMTPETTREIADIAEKYNPEITPKEECVQNLMQDAEKFGYKMDEKSAAALIECVYEKQTEHKTDYTNENEIKVTEVKVEEIEREIKEREAVPVVETVAVDGREVIDSGKNDVNIISQEDVTKANNSNTRYDLHEDGVVKDGDEAVHGESSEDGTNRRYLSEREELAKADARGENESEKKTEGIEY